MLGARAANARHQFPFRAEFVGPQSLVAVDMPQQVVVAVGTLGVVEVFAFEFAGSSVDVKDSFYQFVALEFGSWFCFNEVIIVSDFGVSSCRGGDAQCELLVAPYDRALPCVEAMAMGWAWVFYLCNGVVTGLARSDGMSSPLEDREPVPLICLGSPLVGVYGDILIWIGWSNAYVEAGRGVFLCCWRAAEIRFALCPAR